MDVWRILDGSTIMSCFNGQSTICAVSSLPNGPKQGLDGTE